jgi:hypothetical protein
MWNWSDEDDRHESERRSEEPLPKAGDSIGGRFSGEIPVAGGRNCEGKEDVPKGAEGHRLLQIIRKLLPLRAHFSFPKPTLRRTLYG